MEIKDLENYQLCLSGNYGAKIASTFNDTIKANPNVIFKNKKILEVNGCDIYITEDNMLDFYGFFEDIYQEEYLKKINDYLKRLVLKVENDNLRNEIIEIANLDLSRNSSHHIFNIEILVTCAVKKPDYFFFIYNLLKEKYLYKEEKDNYEFLIFSVYDADTKEKASEIYDAIMENSCNIYNYYMRNRIYDLKSVANNINSAKAQKKVLSNLESIKI